MFAIKFSIEWNKFLEVRRWLNTNNIGRKSEHNGIQEKCPPGKVLTLIKLPFCVSTSKREKRERERFFIKKKKKKIQNRSETILLSNR